MCLKREKFGGSQNQRLDNEIKTCFKKDFFTQMDPNQQMGGVLCLLRRNPKRGIRPRFRL
jgi:hypothetical protein